MRLIWRLSLYVSIWMYALVLLAYAVLSRFIGGPYETVFLVSLAPIGIALVLLVGCAIQWLFLEGLDLFVFDRWED